MEKLLSIEDLAEALQVKKSWLYRRNMESGPDAIPKIRLGKYVRYSMSDVEKWIEKKNSV